jgi:catechol 2,3-dioxygenase-like lactoylglutathione lyase family enzyme
MTDNAPSEETLDSIHHIAISVPNIAAAVDWYCDTFRCIVSYQDETWAMLQFANLQLALVISGEHPPHIGFATSKAADFGELRTHRDGTRSVYISDVAGNAVELLDPDFIDTEL